jgi:hypothetical protein
LARRFSQKSRTVDIDSLGLDGIPFRFVNLEHGAIDDQRRLPVSYATLNGLLIRNIEITVSQRQHIMGAPQTLRHMSANQPCSASNQNFHNR